MVEKKKVSWRNVASYLGGTKVIEVNKVIRLFLIIFLTGFFGFLPTVFAETQSSTEGVSPGKTQIDQNYRALKKLLSDVIILKKQVENGSAVTSKDLELLRKSITANGSLSASMESEVTALQSKITGLNKIIKRTNSENIKLKTLIENNKKKIAELVATIDETPDPEENVKLIENNKKAIAELVAMISTTPDPEYSVKLNLDNDRVAFFKQSVVEGSRLRIPNVEDCSEVGKTFFEDVIIRDWDKFFVEDNGVAKMCEKIQGRWRVKTVSSETLAHVVEVKR